MKNIHYCSKCGNIPSSNRTKKCKHCPRVVPVKTLFDIITAWVEEFILNREKTPLELMIADLEKKEIKPIKNINKEEMKINKITLKK